MAYIGSSAAPLPVAFAGVQSEPFNGGSATYTLSRSVAKTSDIEVVVNNVQQSPFDGSYSVSGKTLTFSETVSAGTGNIYVTYLDMPIGSLVPVDSSVSTAKLAPGAVTAPKMDSANLDGTGATQLPSGTTAQRPATPTNGMVRNNTTTNKVEVYQNNEWINYSMTYVIDYLIVGGGGAGGGTYAGGGGGGGYVAANGVNINSGSVFTVTVGAGGTSSQGNVHGGSGSNSSFIASTAIGGGGGGQWNGNNGPQAGYSGGSGGGGGGADSTTAAGAGGSATAGQGYAGGNGSNFTTGGTGGGGGGGGASAAGANASNPYGGAGGAGLNWQSLGVLYAGGGGGGGGGSPYTGNSGAGGAGGGGNGGSSSNNANSGAANTGGGGGGAGGIGNGFTGSGAPGNGGSGIVIIRYAGAQKGTGGTVTSAGGYTYHTFTSSGIFTA